MAVLYTTTFWLNPETYSWSENPVNENTREVCKSGALNLKPANTSTRVNGYIYKIFIGNLGAYSRSAGEASHKQRSEVRLTNGNPCLWFDWVDRINTDQLILRIQVEGSSIFHEKWVKLLSKLVISSLRLTEDGAKTPKLVLD